MWDVPPQLTAGQVQYREPIGIGLYSCFTFGVDLAHVCNPETSYYQYSSSGFGADNHYCLCYNSSRACPTRDLSQSPTLFFSLTVSCWEVCLAARPSINPFSLGWQ